MPPDEKTTDPSKLGPPPPSSSPVPTTAKKQKSADSHSTTNRRHCGTDTVCRCAEGAQCTCAAYADWEICWPPLGTVSEQLHRRRAASYRLPRGHDGRRDPFSRTVGW